VRGAKILLFTPHPPLRGTLSLRARDLPQTFSDLK
jgi:hypothetical protein